MQLPQKLPLDQMQTRWASILNPVIANLITQGSYIQNILLTSGVPKTINTSLGRLQTGFFIVDQNAAASIFRTKPFSETTLTIEANATVTISLWVF